jgi:hypothetical protein
MLAVLGWIRRGNRRPVWQALLIGFAIVLIVVVAPGSMPWSRGAATKLFGSVLGIVLGVAASASWSRLGSTDSLSDPGCVRPLGALSVAAWTLVLVAQAWQPSNYALTSETAKGALPHLSVVPLDSYRLYSASPFQALHEMLVKMLLGVPLGLLLRLTWRVADEQPLHRLQDIATICIATIVLVVIALGQLSPPMRFPDVSDILIGVIGALAGTAIGAAVARRHLNH